MTYHVYSPLFDDRSISVHASVCLSICLSIYQVVDNVNKWLYVSEFQGNRVRRISLDIASGGLITSIFGTSAPGYTGDLGPGTLATPGR